MIQAPSPMLKVPLPMLKVPLLMFQASFAIHEVPSGQGQHQEPRGYPRKGKETQKMKQNSTTSKPSRYHAKLRILSTAH